MPSTVQPATFWNLFFSLPGIFIAQIHWAHSLPSFRSLLTWHVSLSKRSFLTTPPTTAIHSITCWHLTPASPSPLSPYCDLTRSACLCSHALSTFPLWNGISMRGVIWLHPLIYLQCPGKCWTYSRCSRNVCLMNEWYFWINICTYRETFGSSRDKMITWSSVICGIMGIFFSMFLLYLLNINNEYCLKNREHVWSIKTRGQRSDKFH